MWNTKVEMLWQQFYEYSEIEFLTFSSETKSEVMRKCEEGRQTEKLNKEN